MRKITRLAADAFINGRTFNRDNTSVVVSDNFVAMYLHGNRIAYRMPNHCVNRVFVSLAGWPTPTTKERVNGLLRAYGNSGGFYQRKHVQYNDIGGKEFEVVDDNHFYEVLTDV